MRDDFEGIGVDLQTGAAWDGGYAKNFNAALTVGSSFNADRGNFTFTLMRDRIGDVQANDLECEFCFEAEFLAIKPLVALDSFQWMREPDTWSHSRRRSWSISLQHVSSLNLHQCGALAVPEMRWLKQMLEIEWKNN